jgi:hypothetical protein
MYENIIVIPYRNREKHLDYFVKNTVPLIQTHLPTSKVVVVEQNEGKLFNRGALLNVGFKEYENKTKYFFTHDVNLNPTKEIIKTVYTKDINDMYRIKSAHYESLGGIIKAKHEIIFNINGFPNHIWGWGIEDRVLYYRCYIKDIKITNNTNDSFKILPHTSNAENYKNEKKIISDIWRKPNIDSLNKEEKEKLIQESGLNTINYKILSRKNIHDIVEIIKVDLF